MSAKFEHGKAMGFKEIGVIRSLYSHRKDQDSKVIRILCDQLEYANFGLAQCREVMSVPEYRKAMYRRFKKNQ